jgi:hypothetical protein
MTGRVTVSSSVSVDDPPHPDFADAIVDNSDSRQFDFVRRIDHAAHRRPVTIPRRR